MLHNCKSFNLVHLPVSNLHQGRAGQFTMTMKILLVCMMYDYYDFSICFYLFLFLDKIIHLRMINDFFSRQKYVLVRKKVDSADETNNLWQESSLSLRHNIVHIWGTPTSCQVEIYRKKISVQT